MTTGSRIEKDTQEFMMNRFFHTRRRIMQMGGKVLFLPFAYSSLPLISVKEFREKSMDQKSDIEAIGQLLKSKESHCWLFTGDSITQGAKHTHGYRSYPEIFQERIRWEMGRTQDVIVNTGISGQTTVQVLDDFERRVARFMPSVVFIMLGTNDCAGERIKKDLFRQNLLTTISKIRTLKAIPVLQTPNIILSAYAPERKSLPDYISEIREIANQKALILIDHHQHWNDSLSNSMTDVYKLWLNDPLHPNQYGHQQMARLIFKELKMFDARASTCGAPNYEGIH